MMTAGINDVKQRMSELQEQLTRAKKELNDLRRSLPPETVREYQFVNADGAGVMLSDLFGDRRDLIMIHNMGKSCPYCTLWADGFNGLLPHFEDRAAFVVVSPDAPEVQREFADSRGWRFAMWSPSEGHFLRDMNMADEKGAPWPGVSVFKKLDDSTIVRTGYDYFGPGDDYCSIWHIMDLFPEGSGGWTPKSEYD